MYLKIAISASRRVRMLSGLTPCEICTSVHHKSDPSGSGVEYLGAG